MRDSIKVVNEAAAQPARDVLHAAGHRAGVRTERAELIRDGSNVVYRLPNGMVARIGRTGTRSDALREIAVARWLADTGMSVTRAMIGLDQPTMVGDRPVTWWALLPDHRPATPTELGTVLRDLHALAIPDDLRLPRLDPLTGMADRIAGSRALPPADRSWLVAHLAELHEACTRLPVGLPHRAVHGSAWQGNLVVPDQGPPVLLDLETVSIGPPEWDLVPLAVDHTDFERITAEEYRAFVEAYGGYDVTEWPGYRTLAAIRELRWVCFVLRKADTDAAARHEAGHRIACLRGEVARPWRWSAF